MKKKSTQEELSFTLPDTMLYTQKTTNVTQNINNYLKNNYRSVFYQTAIFGSYMVLNLSIVLFNNFSWFIPLVFSIFIAIILRVIIGPIHITSSKNTEIIPQKETEKVKIKEKIQNDIVFVKCYSCGEKTRKDPLKAPLFCDSCGVEFTKSPTSRPIGIIANKRTQQISESIVPISNEKTEDISEYLALLKNTFEEEEKDYIQSKDSPEDLFLKKLDDVQKLLKLKQDKIRKFKKDRKKIAVSFDKKRQAIDLETVKNVKFTCQACDKEYEGSIKRVNGSIFVVYENEDLILQKTNTGYTFYYEHKVDKATHQTFINLGKRFNVLSSEVIISANGIASKKKEDTTSISDQEKFIPELKYPCSLCKNDFKVKNYTKIKYESANHSTFVHIQTQHTNKEQHHLATLRIDLIDKMLVATPNVQLLTPIQMVEEINEAIESTQREEKEDHKDSEKQIEATV